MFTRHDFIRLIGSMRVFVLTPTGKFFKVKNNGLLDNDIKGELYGGFVLLSADANEPSFIVPAKSKKPRDKDKSVIIYTDLNSIHDLKSYVEKPIYIINDMKNKVEFVHGFVLCFDDGDMIESSLGYTDKPLKYSTDEINIILSANYNYPKPL